MLGAFLRDLRHRAGVRAEEAANRVGVTRAALYNWETGEFAPTPENLHALLAIYHATDAESLAAWRHRAEFQPADRPRPASEDASDTEGEVA